jgi:hypothetical protein
MHRRLSTPNNISSRARTTAAVSWSPVPWTTIEEGWVSADVAGLVSDWVDGTWLNYGLMLNSPSQAGDRYLSSEYSDVDKRPWLQVCYVAP